MLFYFSLLQKILLANCRTKCTSSYPFTRVHAPFSEMHSTPPRSDVRVRVHDAHANTQNPHLEGGFSFFACAIIPEVSRARRRLSHWSVGVPMRICADNAHDFFPQSIYGYMLYISHHIANTSHRNVRIHTLSANYKAYKQPKGICLTTPHTRRHIHTHTQPHKNIDTQHRSPCVQPPAYRIIGPMLTLLLLVLLLL